MADLKGIAKVLQESEALGCGCCAEYPDAYTWDDNDDYIRTEFGKRADELGISPRYLAIAEALVEAGVCG